MAVLFPTTSFSSSYSSPLFLSSLSLIIHASFANNGDNATSVTVTNPDTDTPPPLSPPPPRKNSSSFKPTVVVVFGLLATILSLSFLLLLYAKHCNRRDGDTVYVHRQHRFDGYRYSYGYGGGAASRRKNSGIDRTIIESLPVFRFGALSSHKDGLECAVCLARFERPTEVLRLLPKCNHAFHVECVDTWLDAHSTCPLCRYRVDPEDILLIGDNDSGPDNIEPAPPDRIVSWFRRVSGRHSSAGEKASRLSESNGNESGPQTASYSSSKQSRDPTSFRRSFDSSLIKKKTVTVGCLVDRAQRKDGLLIPERKSFERRLEHRILISNHRDHRWSDVMPSDLLYIRSEMILSDSHKLAVE